MNRHLAHRTAMVVACAALAALAACGGSDGGAPAPSPPTASPSSTSSTLVGPDPTITATSVAPSTAPDASTTPDTSATTSTTSTTTTTPPTTEPPEAATVACLQGQWLLDGEATTGLHAALLPGFPVAVEGSQQLTFEGDAVEYYINEVLQFTPAGADISVPVDQRSAGTYSLAGGAISMNYTTIDGGVDPATGAVTNSKGETIDVFAPLIGPDFTLPSVGGAPVSCGGDTLTIGVTSGLVDADAVFRRV